MVPRMPPPGGLMASCERPGVRSRRKTTKVSVFSPALSLSGLCILCGALWGKQSRHRTVIWSWNFGFRRE